MRMRRSLVATLVVASTLLAMHQVPVSARGPEGPEHRCLDIVDQASRRGITGVLMAGVLDPWCLVGAAVDAGVVGYGIAGCRSLPPTLHRCPHMTQGTWTQDLTRYGIGILRRIAGADMPDDEPPVILPHGVTESPSADAPRAVLEEYLAAVRVGDCAAGRRYTLDTFSASNGDLCGSLTVTDAAIDRLDPVFASDDEVVFSTTMTTMTTTGGDASMPDGTVTWFYDLQRQPDGRWLLTGGGSGRDHRAIPGPPATRHRLVPEDRQPT